MGTFLLSFHLWNRSNAGHAFSLLTAFLERHPDRFMASLAAVWGRPSTDGTVVHDKLNDAQKNICVACFRQLRGNRLKMFLSTLSSIAQGLFSVEESLAAYGDMVGANNQDEQMIDLS